MCANVLACQEWRQCHYLPYFMEIFVIWEKSGEQTEMLFCPHFVLKSQ